MAVTDFPIFFATAVLRSESPIRYAEKEVEEVMSGVGRQIRLLAEMPSQIILVLRTSVRVVRPT